MRYRIITYGCQMNESDSEKIAVLLQKQGHKPAKNEVGANLIVINVCSVRQAAVHRVYAKVNRYYKTKKIILAGCVLEKDKKQLKDKVAEFWHPDHYFNCSPREIFNSPSPPLKLRGGWGALSAYVPIMTGCNNFCSYCVVPYTRGREKSRPAKNIIAEVKSLVRKGYKEIMLLGQNVNSYRSQSVSSSPQTRGGLRWGVDLKTPPPPTPSSTEEGWRSSTVNFAKLLKIINGFPGNFRLTFLTSHPKDMSDELIATMVKCKKLKKELHLPVQSGDNTILHQMNRHYTASHYKSLIKKIRRAIPDIKISTDVIVGFPGETKKQFQNSVKLAKAVKFDGAFIAKYSPRPGTAAAKLKDDVSVSEKKRRWRILDTLINKFEH